MEVTFCECDRGCQDNRCLCFNNEEYCAEDCQCRDCNNLRVSMETRQFVESCITSYYQRITKSYESAPEEVRLDLLAELDEQSNQNYSLTEYDIIEIESQIPADLPPALIAYLTTKFRVRIGWGQFILSENPAEVLALIQTREYWHLGYLLFASGECGDPVFLDFSQPKADGEFPVVVINHDLAPDQAWNSRKEIIQYAKEVAPTFKDFLSALCEDRLSY